MSKLKLRLLGPPVVELDETLVEVKPRKALAVLIYLACAGSRQARDTLATLLWPETGQSQARASLRRRLSELDQTLGGVWLHTDRDNATLVDAPGLQIDVADFEAHLAACTTHGHGPGAVCALCGEPLAAAVALYEDDFLTGFTLSDCPEFDDWQFFQAESLRQELASALARLVQLHRDQGDPAAAAPHARRWIALDPLHEPAHRALMQLYDETGQRSAALRQYELCVRTLEAEMGVPPETETTDLYRSIRTRQTAAPDPARTAEPAPPADPEQPIQPAPFQDEVRMATVLALDVDARLEEDWDHRPDEIARRIAGFLCDAPSLLARYQAQIAHTHDSGLRVLFGLPELHEDDAERAIHAALALRESAREQDLDITAGVNTGMVYVSHAQGDGERTATGPTVNLAQRLKGQAPFGSVLVGATTHYQTEQAFRFTPHELAMSGRPEPVAVYEALRPRRHMVKSRGIGSLHAPLIGRDEELAKLTAALANVRQGQGQLVTVIGEAGLGKSRLVAELKAAVMDEIGEDETGSILWLEGRCLEMNRSVAYWPFVDILQSYFGWMPHTPESERARTVTTALEEFVQQKSLADEQVEIMGPILGQLLSLRFGNDWDDRLQNARPEQIRYQTFQTLREFAGAVAQRQPLVLVLEDIHWADPLSLDLTGHLMELLEGTPLLLLCVFRPEAALKQDRLAPLASRKCPAAFTEIRLRELTPDNSRALVEALLHVEGLTPATKNRILDTCQGNPFFLEEVIHDLIEADLIYHDGDVWRARQEIETTAVPTRVQSVILARVDRLETTAKQALQHAAVIGRLFSLQVLASALPQDINVDDALADLEERAFIYPEQTVPNVVYSFRHVLAQEAVYQTIPGQRRAALHAGVGETLEHLYHDELDEVVGQLACHYDRSDAADKAIEYLLRAGDKAARAYLTDEAVAHYQRALQRIDEMEPDEAAAAWRFHALSELGKTYMRSSQYDDAETTLRQAIAWGLAQGLPAKQVARLHWWLGDLLMNWNVRFEETLQTGLDGLALLDDEDDESVEAAMMYSIIAFGYYFRNDRKRLQEITSHLASFLNRLPYSEEFRVCYGCILEACVQRKDLDQMLKWLDLAEERARRHHDDWALAEHLWTRSGVLCFTGADLDTTMEAMRMSILLFDRVGDAKRVNWAEVGLGDLMGDYGESSQAETHLRQVLESVYTVNELYVYDVLLKLASSCLAQHKWPQAREALQEALQQMEKHRDIPAEALTLLGFVELANGNTAPAVEQFSQVLHALADPDSLFHLSRKWHLMVNSFFANALYGLECALDDSVAFRAFCREFRAQHPAANEAVFTQWYLGHAKPTEFSSVLVMREQFDGPLPADWNWYDLDGGCTFEVEHGLTIWAPPVRDLWCLLRNAPRMMRSVAGDFSAQVICEPACTDRPGIGGILLWQDKSNYLRLSIGVRAQDEMSLEGCIADEDVVIGRGRLPAERVTLRLERLGDTVRALCSADGDEWFTVGQVDFPVPGPVQVGLHAIGFVDRTIYHSPYPEGTAIRFTDFQLWN